MSPAIHGGNGSNFGPGWGKYGDIENESLSNEALDLIQEEVEAAKTPDMAPEQGIWARIEMESGDSSELVLGKMGISNSRGGPASEDEEWHIWTVSGNSQSHWNSYGGYLARSLSILREIVTDNRGRHVMQNKDVDMIGGEAMAKITNANKIR